MFRPFSFVLRSSAGALACTLLFPVASLAAAETSGPPRIVVSAPEEFADLREDRTLLVDIYFGGSRRGEALIVATPDSIRFLEIEALLALFPELLDRQAVERALAGQSLPANADRVCSPNVEPERCGRLSPEQIGVIFDRERFRIDIFLNPRLLEFQDAAEDRYLPPPNAGLSLITAVGGVFSGRVDGGREYYNLQDQLVLAWGERRIRADTSYASELGLGAERLVFEWDRPERRYSIGALWAPGNGNLGRRKLIGLGLETQIDTRQDRDSILGSPVVVFLDRRARIDIIRGGRVLSSAVYEAGNQELETSNLPDGSYEILLRIEEIGRPAREERRFYTKSRRIPSEGRTDFFLYGGLLVDSFDSGSLKPSDRPYFQGGIAHRLNAGLALDGGLQASDDVATAELGMTFLTSVAQVRGALILDTAGAHGTMMHLATSGTSRLHVNFDFRHIRSGNQSGTSSPLVAPPGTPAEAFDLAVPYRPTDYSQLGGMLSYSLGNMRFLGTVFYRDDKGQPARYSVGPSFEWDLLRKGPVQLTLRGDLTATERGNSGFAGISLRLFGKRSMVAALAGGRSSTRPDDDLGEGAVAALSGAWNFAAAGGELAMGGGYERRPRQDDLILSSEFRHPLGSLGGDFVRSEGVAEATGQYAVSFQTTLAAGAGALRMSGRTTAESMILAMVEGAREDDWFDVIVNEQIVGKIKGKELLTLSLPAYRAYRVRIRSVGEGLVSYDGSTREIGLYPGSITRLVWNAEPMMIKFGRLVDPDGHPIRGAAITGKGVWSQTDQDGYFQVEAPDDAELRITLRDGQTSATRLPSANDQNGFAQLGQVVCCSDTQFRVGALASAPDRNYGESR